MARSSRCDFRQIRLQVYIRPVCADRSLLALMDFADPRLISSKSSKLLHLCGLFRPLRAGVAAKNAGREDGAPRACDSIGLVGNFCDASDPESHDFSVTSIEAQSQSLAEHCLGRALYRDHSHHDVALGVLYILRSHRDRADGTCGLVCMELAQTENKIIKSRLYI